MALITRRDALQVGLGALAGTTMLGSRSLLAEIAVTDVAPPKFDLEAGASLRVLRPSKFVQGDETLFLENSKKFADQWGSLSSPDLSRTLQAIWKDCSISSVSVIAEKTDPELICSYVMVSGAGELEVAPDKKRGGLAP